MKTAIAALILISGTSAASAQYNPYGNAYGTGANPQNHGVQGYYNNNGTYTQPHYQTNPNSTQMDNYGTRGNQNPYTGVYGTRTPRY